MLRIFESNRGLSFMMKAYISAYKDYVTTNNILKSLHERLFSRTQNNGYSAKKLIDTESALSVLQRRLQIK